MAGLPEAPRAFVPQPVMGKTAAGAARLCRRQGPDHRPAGDAGGHRGPHHGAERHMSAVRRAFERTTPRLVEPDTEDNLQRLFLENHWTDYLPIVLPTEERVAAMLARHQPQARRGRRPHAADRNSAAPGSTRSRRWR